MNKENYALKLVDEIILCNQFIMSVHLKTELRNVFILLFKYFLRGGGQEV